MSKGFGRRTALTGATAGMVMAVLRGEQAHAAAPAREQRSPGALNAATKRAFAWNQTVAPLVPDRLYRFGCLIRAERLSWLAEDLDSYEALNGYLLTDGENVCTVDMGAQIMLPAL